MNSDQIIEQTKKKFASALSHFEDELKKLRTGRAHASMLDGIVVQAYGQPMPLIQIGSVTVPEPQLLQITPFDASNLQAIAAAIRENQSLGLNPMDDGRVVRVPIPQLTTERRQQIVKLLGEKSEECMISMRNARHEALKAADQAKLSQDESARLQKQVDEIMSKQKAEVESLSKDKEKEILTV